MTRPGFVAPHEEARQNRYRPVSTAVTPERLGIYHDAEQHVARPVRVRTVRWLVALAIIAVVVVFLV